MVPVPLKLKLSSLSLNSTRYVHVLHLAFSAAVRYVTQRDSGLFGESGWGGSGSQGLGTGMGAGGYDSISGNGSSGSSTEHHRMYRRMEIEHGSTKYIVFVVLIPVLVLMSGLFAGLTLGYMSLDETQLNVLSVSGTPQQREYANKIKPIRKNGHLLLVTLLLANMIVNESLPIIADPILGGGVQSVVVSTVLIVIFSEIIPQSLFTRHGLYLGAKGAGLTTVLIYALGVVSWPVAKFLEWVLGPHHGIIYRRAELKELIAMHSNQGVLGGDLKRDTVTIIGATLDLQEKVVKQAMTPIDDVFMLSIDAELDYNLLKKICETGHSRVPVYEEIDIPIPPDSSSSDNGLGMLSALPGISNNGPPKERTQRVKKILGILLVKNCVMLDPKDATPIRSMPLNKVPFIPNNEPLLGILDKFQEGRSHMAIVSRFSVEKAQSVKKAVKRGLTQRLRERVGMGDTDSSSSSSSSENDDEERSIGFSIRKKRGGSGNGRKKGVAFTRERSHDAATVTEEEEGEEGEEPQLDPAISEISREKSELSNVTVVEGKAGNRKKEDGRRKGKKDGRKKERGNAPGVASPREQSMPADAVLAKEGAEEFLQNFEPAVMPMGIITLEDVLEELIGEEIYDEFDAQGAHGDPYQVPLQEPVLSMGIVEKADSHGPDGGVAVAVKPPKTQQSSLRQLKSLGFLRSRSAPPVRRDGQGKLDVAAAKVGGPEDKEKVDLEEENQDHGPGEEERVPAYTVEDTDVEGDDPDDLTHSGRSAQLGLNRMASSAPTTRAPSPSNLGGGSASLPSGQLLQGTRKGSLPPSREDPGVNSLVVGEQGDHGISVGMGGGEVFGRAGQRGMAFKSRPVSPAGEQDHVVSEGRGREG